MKVSSGKEDVVGCNFVPNFSLLLPEENSKPLPKHTACSGLLHGSSGQRNVNAGDSASALRFKQQLDSLSWEIYHKVL